VAAFARYNIITNVNGMAYASAPAWFTKWEDTGLIAWIDKNGDGIVQYRGGPALEPSTPVYSEGKGEFGQRLVSNQPAANANELYIDRDIIVLAHPEIAQLPNWVIALVAAGGLAAALSTAAGLLLVISTAVSHDLMKKTFMPHINDRQELMAARVAAAVAVGVAGLFGIYPPGFVAQVVAFAFGLAAASFFPVLLLGIFLKRMNKEAAVAGMVTGQYELIGREVIMSAARNSIARPPMPMPTMLHTGSSASRPKELAPSACCSTSRSPSLSCGSRRRHPPASRRWWKTSAFRDSLPPWSPPLTGSPATARKACPASNWA